MATLHFVYIVPSDDTENTAWTSMYYDFATDMQDFYAAQLNNGKSFNCTIDVITSIYATSVINATTNVSPSV